jgi:hypothetical protein
MWQRNDSVHVFLLYGLYGDELDNRWSGLSNADLGDVKELGK